MRILLPVCIFACFLSACSTKVTELSNDTVVSVVDSTIILKEDWECIAGEKAGIITGTSSEQELIDILGKENVSPHATLYGAEGLVFIGTILYKGTPNEAHVIWRDTLNFKNPEYVEVGFAEPGDWSEVKWFTNSGIKIGATLTELERLNDGVFEFSGFGWDQGGAIIDWLGGRLSDKNQQRYLSVAMTYDFELDEIQSAAEKLMGDTLFNSDDPNARKLNPFVSHFIIRFK